MPQFYWLNNIIFLTSLGEKLKMMSKNNTITGVTLEFYSSLFNEHN